MIFVPFPLFASFCLLGILVHLVRTRDLSSAANQLFALLVGLYALQSLLLCLRWGYGFESFTIWIGFNAPILPILAYFAFNSLTRKLHSSSFWPLGLLVIVWACLMFAPDIADVAIMLVYLGFGLAIFINTFGATADLALVRIGQTEAAIVAMRIIALALIGSAFADLFVLIDFIQNAGQNVGLAVTLLQTGFLLVVGVAALMGDSVKTDAPEIETIIDPNNATEDAAVMQRLNRLFEVSSLHRDTELNLRRLSRRLGVPDRSVSQAVNRTMGMSVSQYVNSYRIKDACKLLKTTDKSILQISMAAGFLSKSNFNREFTRITQKSPSRWRQDELN